LVLQKGGSVWEKITGEQTFCPGEMLRTAADSRLTVLLADDIILRIDQETTLSFPENIQEKPLLLQVVEGILHIFSHRPRSLQVNTPFVNGAVEGTEFLVEVDSDSTSISVYKGLVLAANDDGTLNVAEDQTVLATKGAPPRYGTVIRSRDAINWTLYYPIIMDAPAVDMQDSAATLAGRAARKLSVGRIEEAQKYIAESIERDPGNSEALALKAIIAVVQGERDQALNFASRAITADPQSAAAALALSYARQAHFDIHGALDILERSSRSHPGNAQVLARLAELQLSTGETDNALQTARQAVDHDPLIGRTQAVLGFVHLARGETGQAMEAFNHAITLDQILPLARLGLGLARIRSGDLAGGRSEIEIAAALNPGSALIRSYLGKAYFEEKRDDRSRLQFEMAKTLDPADPTPWFYDAIRKQAINRPVESLRDLQRSIALNDNRAVYRSRLLLDEDLAARSTSLGRIYADLGFQQLALVEGRESVQIDPANFSAHRFLADSYSALPRHEIAKVSELLLSQLYQPINVTPVQPQLAESDLAILDGAGPITPAFNEFNPLFLRNRLALQASGVIGGNDTIGDELVMSGVWNNYSYSLGHFHYQTDGIRPNNDEDQDILTAFSQVRVKQHTSLLGEIRHKEREYGDLELLFDPDIFSANQRQNLTKTTYRLGMNHVFGPSSEVITAFTGQDVEDEINDTIPIGKLTITEKNEGYIAELQHLLRRDRLHVVSGLGYYDGDLTGHTVFSRDIPYIPDDKALKESDVVHGNAYLYSYLKPFDALRITLGLSYDSFDNEQHSQDQFNPKVGLSWNIFDTTMIRLAAFKVLTRTLISDQTIEPTQTAGFNQFFDDVQGTETWAYGIAADHTFSESFFGGAEFMTRRQDVPYEDIDLSMMIMSTTFNTADWQEELGRAYLYWTPCSLVSAGLEYFYEDFDRGDTFFGTDNIQDLTTHRFRIGGGLFHPNGVSAKIRVSYISQEGTSFDPLLPAPFTDSDYFWVVDAELRYRLPDRLGFLSLEAKNFFDGDFKYQAADPAHPDISPDQLFLFKLSLSL
jgi:tetratricopeptide (TPR) repeat protein